jgi:enoyl-CoA hydratase
VPTEIVKQDRVCTVAIKGQNEFNSLSTALLTDLENALDAVAGDEEIRLVVITGCGKKAFSAGADIPELLTMTPKEALAHSEKGQAILNKLEGLAQPTIGAVNGVALGGGFELALACDMRVASSAAKFGFPEVSLGVMPGWGGTQRLARLIGRGRAMEMILTGTRIGAEQAFAMGLANNVVAPGELENEVAQLARAILKNGPLAVQHAKNAVNRGLNMDFHEGCGLEARLFAESFGPEQREGMSAFVERRTPGWIG